MPLPPEAFTLDLKQGRPSAALFYFSRLGSILFLISVYFTGFLLGIGPGGAKCAAFGAENVSSITATRIWSTPAHVIHITECRESTHCPKCDVECENHYVL